MNTPWTLLALFSIAMLPGACAEDVPLHTPAPVPPTFDEVVSELGFQSYLDNTPQSVTQLSPDEAAHTFDPAGPARCFDGSPFTVTVRKGTSPNLMVFFQGGGACWDQETCFVNSLAREASLPMARDVTDTGIFSAVSENPFANWSLVYASYCDGSLWMGDADVRYGNQTAYHHGMANVAATLALAKLEFPSPKQLAVVGSSAGGFGTLLGYVVARSQYGETPIIVLNDSGPWVLNPDEVEMTQAVLANWNHWNVAAFREPTCPDCRVDLYRIADWAVTQDANSRWGLFAYEKDIVIADLYLKFKERYPETLRGLLAYLETRNPERFYSYVTPGANHTITGSEEFASMSVEGVKLQDWVGDLVSGAPGLKSAP